MYSDNFNFISKIFRFKNAFIFIAILVGVFFFPKDAHAMSIRIYDYDWNIVDECTNCTSLINNDWYPEDIYTIYFYYDNYQVVKNMEYEIENTFSLFVANPNLDLQMYAPVVWVNFVSQTYFSDYFAINRTESTSVPNLGTVYRHQIGSKGHFTSNTTITGTEFYENTVIYEFRYMQPLTFQGVRMDSYHLINLGDSTGDSINNATNNIINNNNQNTQDIINNNDKNTDKIVEGQDKINDSLNDDNVDDANDTASGFFNDFELSDNGGISSIVTMPLRVINGLITGENNCSSLNFSILEKDVYFPGGCMMWDKVSSVNETLYQTIICGFFGYILLVMLFKDIEQLKNPNDEEVSTLDL